MLVVSRKIGEKLCIGDSLAITVLSVHKGYVRLGFDAPLDVAIQREEIRRRRGVSIPEDQQEILMT
jgi:carbon storage regulator